MRAKNFLAILPVAIALATNFSLSTFSSAQAQSFNTRAGQLPDASRVYPSKLKLQIVDEDPEVRDIRKPKDRTVYQINIPPAPQSTTNVVQIGAPSTAASNGVSGGSNSVPIMTPSLPFAGSHSNISPHQSLANQLPSGTSTTGLHGVMAKRPTQSAPLAQVTPTAKLSNSPRPTTVATYPSTSSGSSVNQSQITTTNAHGSLLNQGKNK